MENITSHPNSALIAIPNRRGIITKSLTKAAFYLNKGEVVAIPTETVYGLAASIFDEKAINKIFEIKERPSFNPLIVHIDSIQTLEKVAINIPTIAYDLANQFWPGPLTMILEKNKLISDAITGGKNTVAVRMPNHPITLKLLKTIGTPLAAPSANPFGSISPTSAKHVEKYFKNKLDVILDGGSCSKGIESTIIAFKNNEVIVYRLGSLSIEMLVSVVGKVRTRKHNTKNYIAPGMLAKHYAPKTPMILCVNPLKTASNLIGRNIGILLFDKKLSNPDYFVEILSADSNLEEAAKNLYAAMHKLDEKGFDLLIAQKFPNVGLGKAINDRLSRACKKETNFTPNNIFI